MLASICLAMSLTVISPDIASYHSPQPGATEKQRIVEELRGKYQSAVDELSKKNTGAEAVARQREIADLLKKLLEQNDPPPSDSPPSSPPPPSSDRADPPPTRTPPTPMPLPASEDSAKKQEAAPPSAPKLQPTPTPAKSAALPPLVKPDDARKANLDGWQIVMPRRHAQDVDAYARGRLMDRYEEILRQYYRTIAESDRRKNDE